jgi:hypothetical protein
MVTYVVLYVFVYFNAQFCTANRLRQGDSVRLPAEQDVFNSSREQTKSGATSFRFIEYRGIFPRGKAAWSARLTSYLHLVPQLRMSGTKPPLTLYSLMSCTGTATLLLPLLLHFLYRFEL